MNKFKQNKKIFLLTHIREYFYITLINEIFDTTKFAIDEVIIIV